MESKEQRAAYARAWYAEHREEVRAKQNRPRAKAIKAAWKKKNAAKIKAQERARRASMKAEGRAYWQLHADELKAKKRAYYLANQDRIKEKVRAYRAAHRTEINAARLAEYHALSPAEKHARNQTTYAMLDPEKRRKHHAAYYQSHKAERLAYARKYDKSRSARDPSFKLARWCRLRIRQALKFYKTSATASKLLGCSVAEFRSHLESQFKPGMTWGNWARDGWHIDHIKPLASFDLTKASERRKAFHWSNHQPLWWRENLAKGSRSGVA